MWGEWIEIGGGGGLGSGETSLPVWGEWIEISAITIPCSTARRSLPVWGEWIEILKILAEGLGFRVSPRVGRVD